MVILRFRSSTSANFTESERLSGYVHSSFSQFGKEVRFPGEQCLTSYGKVRLTVVSKPGKEVVTGILNDGSFFGEGSLAGQPLRMGSATAITDCAVLRIEKKAMLDTLHREHALSDLFVAYLLRRNIRTEEDLVDQLFNSTEKRLARVLLMLAGKEGVPESVVPKISQETLAEMVGTTQSRVNLFMNRFRKLGFIDYAGGAEGGLKVHKSLLSVILPD